MRQLFLGTRCLTRLAAIRQCKNGVLAFGHTACGGRPEMANEFYDAGVERATRVKALFTRIAPRYDLINDLQSFGLHRRWKKRVIELSGAQPGVRALDVCCGTGDIALGMARRGAAVVGLDFSERMLGVAEARRERAGLVYDRGVPNPQFVPGDALALPFAENSFEVVTVGYGLRNLADWQTGLAEMRRVAAPGGRIVVLDFGKPGNPAWRTLYFGYLKAFVPLLGLVFCGSAGAYGYILESLKHYPAQEGVAGYMQELDLKQRRTFNLLGGIMSINYGEK